jgi:hypothetical protein
MIGTYLFGSQFQTGVPSYGKANFGKVAQQPAPTYKTVDSVDLRFGTKAKKFREEIKEFYKMYKEEYDAGNLGKGKDKTTESQLADEFSNLCKAAKSLMGLTEGEVKNYPASGTILEWIDRFKSDAPKWVEWREDLGIDKVNFSQKARTSKSAPGPVRNWAVEKEAFEKWIDQENVDFEKYPMSKIMEFYRKHLKQNNLETVGEVQLRKWLREIKKNTQSQ